MIFGIGSFGEKANWNMGKCYQLELSTTQTVIAQVKRAALLSTTIAILTEVVHSEQPTLLVGVLSVGDPIDFIWRRCRG